LCRYIIAAAVLAMSIPGLALLPEKVRYLTEFGLIGHAIIICHLENRVYNFAGIYNFSFDEAVVYPSYLVVVTTVVGLVLVRRLGADKRIGPLASWVLICLYLSKLSMFFLSSHYVVWAATLLLLAITPPLVLYK
jgi:Na+/melibiose symporter-like transporter